MDQWMNDIEKDHKLLNTKSVQQKSCLDLHEGRYAAYSILITIFID